MHSMYPNVPRQHIACKEEYHHPFQS
uniref:Uncharacterized protein n=1 Tax=Rhizophora mucronata TaxID=61149 RepID=A0A2P2NS30_RHIMU